MSGIMFVVSGNDVPLPAPPETKLSALVTEAIERAGYTGSELTWEVRYENGVRITAAISSQSVGALGIPNGAIVFITPEVGHHG